MPLPEDVQSIAAEWRDALWAPKGDWCPDPNREPAAGTYGGYFVRGPNRLAAYLKPTDSYDWSLPQAANEKIVADLAWELSLPVAPVVLHQRPNPPTGEESRCCLSLVVLDENKIWSSLFPMGVPREDALAILRASCGLVALDTYVHNEDSKNGERAAYDTDDDGRPARLVAFDCANSLNISGRWERGGWRRIPACTMPGPPAVLTDPSVLRAAIERIEALPDLTIESIVNRIPDDYMAPTHRSVVIEGLKGRRALIRSHLADLLQT